MTGLSWFMSAVKIILKLPRKTLISSGLQGDSVNKALALTVMCTSLHECIIGQLILSSEPNDHSSTYQISADLSVLWLERNTSFDLQATLT